MISPKNPPALILIAGLPASGKTWFARALAADLGALHLNSDTVRTAMNLRGHYDPDSKQRVYQALFQQAEQGLRDGRIVVVDATFYKNSLRSPWLQLAGKCGASCHLIEIRIPESLALQRLQLKRQDSEATPEVFFQIRSQWENIESPHLTMDAATYSPEEMVAMAKEYFKNANR